MSFSKGQDQKAERIARMLALCEKKLGKKTCSDISAFAEQYFRRTAPEDVLSFTPENLYGATLGLFKFLSRRKPGELKLRVYNPRMEEHGWSTPHTVIEIITDDMPFLVDSVSAALGTAGYTIHQINHPVLKVKRDKAGKLTAILKPESKARGAIAESVMYFEVDEQTDRKELQALEGRLADVIADVRRAVEDWPAMCARVEETLKEIEDSPPPLEKEEIEEGKALLRWMADNHFTFLGYREYDYSASREDEALRIVDGTGLGILRDPNRRIMTRVSGSTAISPEVRAFLNEPELVIVTKANARSTVHRPVYLDYVGIKKFDKSGKVIGERRFIGLLTSAAYNRSPFVIPYLRRKVERTIARARLTPNSHDGKALINILETYPRDELFQISEEDLFDTAMGILRLMERPRIRLFVRRDRFERFNSCLVYVLKEQFNTDLRRRFEEILAKEYNGRIAAFYTQIGDQSLARIHFIVATDPATVRKPPLEEVEALLVEAARTWDDLFFEALTERWGEERGNKLWRIYDQAFPTAYKEAFNAEVALFDIERIEKAVKEGLGLHLYRAIEDEDHTIRLKIYNPGRSMALSDSLPMLEHMGLKVLDELPYKIGGDAEGARCWVHDFTMERTDRAPVEIGAIKQKFEDAFRRIWTGAVEDDGFNRLVLYAGLDWRQVMMLRAYAKYLRQTGVAFSQDYLEDTLVANPVLTGLLCELFETKFDPDGPEKRRQKMLVIKTRIMAELDKVSSLDQDRIIRHFLNLIDSTLRTSFYQERTDPEGTPYLAYKFNSQNVLDLPLPRPFREIFVYSPRVEGVHLRGGKVARGGLRWSDRREDFRTEVLGLMKAQMVKNAVIVPVGSKGGFVPKNLPQDGDREAVMKEGIECYKIFISGLLQLTDNLKENAVIPPERTIRYDEDDPYLVVAADKGTATFSDIANDVAIRHGFWLGDAFASGGRVGYDHKKMGITARGAWESVKRHFREMGLDIQNEPFTVIGIGDMSGDVFGNGMLLSRQIRLLAAFDHRHIFIDPDPDPETSWQERRRLFELPRSSWEDYDKKLISNGGGVFARSLKSIHLSPEIKALFDIDKDSLTPQELIKAILKSRADLLWIGGIGTYVKASGETNQQVGDRANDALRINGRDLRCRVVGEGGNLGFTQRGRIEYALNGGRINTDAIDNSAGVDCSDHEVNIKILLDAIVADGEMTEKQRNRLLAEMTDEVGELVLRDNYLQTQALTVAQAKGHDGTDMMARLMRGLERAGRLDRDVEFLPDEETLEERRKDGAGLTRPELAVLIAYAKMAVYDELLESDLPEEPYLETDLIKYFPRPLRRKFRTEIGRHRLRREIIATVMANNLVNRAGIGFAYDLQEEMNAAAADIAIAYAVTREVFSLRSIWNAIEGLDNRVDAAVQTSMILVTQELLRRGVMWFIRNLQRPYDIDQTISRYSSDISKLQNGLSGVLVDLAADIYDKRLSDLVARDVPADLAARVAALEPLAASLDIVALAGEAGNDILDVARVYFEIGARLGIDWIRGQAEQIPVGDHWERSAIAAIIDDLFAQQRLLTRSVLEQTDAAAEAPFRVNEWEKSHSHNLERLSDCVDECKADATLDIPRLAVISRHLRNVAGLN